MELIAIEHLNKVARVSLNRPQARNAQNTQLLDELHEVFAALREDQGVRVVVLAANGPHFSAGHDLREGQAERAHYGVEQRWVHEEKRFFDYCLEIYDFPKPVVAQVQGACISAGFMMANMCDLIVASESAYFQDPVVHTLAAASVEVLIHPWVLGLRKAKEMLFTGLPVSAAEALQAGMVNQVVPDDQLEAKTLVLAQKIAQAPTFALRLVKRSLNRSVDVQGLRSALNAHFDTHQLTHATGEFAEIKKAGLDHALRPRASA